MKTVGAVEEYFENGGDDPEQKILLHCPRDHGLLYAHFHCRSSTSTGNKKLWEWTIL